MKLKIIICSLLTLLLFSNCKKENKTDTIKANYLDFSNVTGSYRLRQSAEIQDQNRHLRPARDKRIRSKYPAWLWATLLLKTNSRPSRGAPQPSALHPHGPARAASSPQGRSRSARRLHGPAAKPDERTASHEGDD